MTTNDPRRQAENESVVDLAASMIAEARTRIEAEHRDAPPRGTVSTIVMILAIIATLAAGAATIYGIGWLPRDIPIRPFAGGFVGKYGEAHTKDEYEAYGAWSNAMLVTYPASIALWFLFAAVRKSDRH